MKLQYTKEQIAFFSKSGKKGSKLRMQKLSPERRSEIARIGSIARWKKEAEKKKGK